MTDEISARTKPPVKHTWQHATALLTLALSAPLAIAGCTADVNPPSSNVETSADTTEAHGNNAITNVVSAVGQAAGLCAPLTCCFPAGAEWGTDAFQTSLRNLGCTMPQAYTERYGTTDWWMFTQCPVTPALLTLVAENATVSPIYSQLAVNECLYEDSLTSLQLDSIFVEFDPTCSSCRTVSK